MSTLRTQGTFLSVQRVGASLSRTIAERRGNTLDSQAVKSSKSSSIHDRETRDIKNPICSHPFSLLACNNGSRLWTAIDGVCLHRLLQTLCRGSGESKHRTVLPAPPRRHHMATYWRGEDPCIWCRRGYFFKRADPVHCFR